MRRLSYPLRTVERTFAIAIASGPLRSALDMELPPFTLDGVLPLGAHFGDMDGTPVFSGLSSTADEVQSRFVVAYDDSMTRAKLFQEFLFLRETVMESLDCVTFLVAGEFVTAADDPQDVLVVLEAPADNLAKLAPRAQWTLNRLFNGEGWVIGKDDVLKVEARLVRSYPPEHLKFDLGLEEQKLARFLCGSPNEGTTQGYVDILECEGVNQDIAEITESLTA